MGIKRKQVRQQRITDHQPVYKGRTHVEDGSAEPPIENRKTPQPHIRETMIQRILSSRIVKAVASLAGGLLGGMGSLSAGLDPEFAVLVAATAIVAIVLGMEKAAEFKAIFDRDRNGSDRDTQ